MYSRRHPPHQEDAMGFTKPRLASPAARAPTKPTLTPQLLTRIRGEFREMPGLRLTLPQARRLLGLDMVTCSAALAVLQAAGVLTRRDGAFMLADAGAPA
jgi:hypothetical protein